MFENVKADFGRITSAEGEQRGKARVLISALLSQGFQATLVYRFARWCVCKHIPVQPLRFVLERFIEITTGISIPAEAKIDKGLRIHHFGGIIIHSAVTIGKNCTLHQGVTIGDRGNPLKAPRIGDNVFIGAGAKILGDIIIGDNCQVGANAVVIKSVPDNCVVVGVPAKIVDKPLVKLERISERLL
ncbi:serine O-acetyltransferase [bacterium]|nr:serine O-acetyltransferase [bacterium]MBU1754071.1 serine O-acetyltransferase [bacterium]